MSFRTFLLLLALAFLSTSLSLQSHEGSYAYYTRKEVAGKPCKNHRDCDGQRLCVSNACTGIARPIKDANYRYDENITKKTCAKDPMEDVNWRNKDYYCDGKRTCYKGKCIGIAR